MQFIIGQRWVSHTESQLGLGIITNIDGRQVTLSFPATEEQRIYAINNAPLSRVIYKEGDEILTLDERHLIVAGVDEVEGLLHL